LLSWTCCLYLILSIKKKGSKLRWVEKNTKV
jgi:hypothetical protein